MSEEIEVIDVSLDIETLSTEEDAFVISVAACTNTLEFEQWFEPREQIFYDRDIDIETVIWHLNNHPILFGNQLKSMGQYGQQIWLVFSKLEDWLKQLDGEIEVWMNSPSFDSVILKSLAKKAGLEGVPWHYRHERDLRSLKTLAKQKNPDEYSAQLPPTPDNAHDALADAQYQLKIITMCKAILLDT